MRNNLLLIKYLLVITVASTIIACNTATLAQIEIPKEESKYIERDFLRHKRAIYDCFKRYMDYSDFLDTNSYVSASSIEKFKSLFADNALVWNDYLWKAKYEYASAYADQAYYYHRIRGLKVEYEEGVLEDLYELEADDLLVGIVENDEGEMTYKYRFQARKGVYYVLNKEKKVIYYDEPIYYNLEFIFHITTGEKRAKLMDIKLAETSKLK